MVTFSVELGMIKPEKLSGTFTFPPLPDEYINFVGKALLQWGAFEIEFDDVLQTLMIADKKKDVFEKIKKAPFKQRAANFEQSVKSLLNENIPIKKHFLDLLEESKDLQNKRNFLAHGQIRFKQTFESNPKEGILNCAGAVSATLFRDGVEKLMEFEFSDVEQLFYDLGHLRGKFIDLSKDNIHGFSKEESNYFYKTIGHLITWSDGSLPAS
jgi:hypothetical protein